jgi:hypothetical protein
LGYDVRGIWQIVADVSELLASRKMTQRSHLILRKAFTNWHCSITQDMDLCGGVFDATVHAEQFHLNGRIKVPICTTAN